MKFINVNFIKRIILLFLLTFHIKPMEIELHVAHEEELQRDESYCVMCTSFCNFHKKRICIIGKACCVLIGLFTIFGLIFKDKI